MELFAFILVFFLAGEFLQIFVASGKNPRKYDLMYIVKYWSYEDQTTPTDCTNLSCTRPYEIRPMNPLQFFEHFLDRCVLRKKLGFAEMLEISTFVNISTKLFRWYNVPWGVSYNCI